MDFVAVVDTSPQYYCFKEQLIGMKIWNHWNVDWLTQGKGPQFGVEAGKRLKGR